MNRILVPYTLAKKAKEKKFNERCLTFYMKDKRASNNDDWAFGIKNSELTRDFQDCTAPTHQQLIDWLKKKYKITVEPQTKGDNNNWSKYHTKYIVLNWGGMTPFKNEFTNLDKAILEALKLIRLK
jgi:hypothetical protein